MKKTAFLIGALLAFAAEIIVLIIFAVQPSGALQDTVEVNEVVQTVTRDFGSLDKHTNATGLDYVVLDGAGNVLYATRQGLSESVNAAIAHRDTILDITVDNSPAGKVIIYNGGAESAASQKRTVMAVMASAIAVECGICLGYALYLRATLINPFKKLKGFAERVAGGNLDIPLEMDRHNLFGAFTESFDIMRAELKRARLAEAQAERSKKELVAKLSHDIKTPVASIKAVSEVGLAIAANGRNADNYRQIIVKADQINSLVTNLFTATLEELQQLTVTPTYIPCGCVKSMLENADYLHRAAVPDIRCAAVYADRLRLQQVFDNIFANSYKYAGTEIFVTAFCENRRLNICVEDCGGGVAADEVAHLKEKFRRGSNAANTEGAGLGLFISDYFMTEMGGTLTVENGARGLKVTVTLVTGADI